MSLRVHTTVPSGLEVPYVPTKKSQPTLAQRLLARVITGIASASSCAPLTAAGKGIGCGVQGLHSGGSINLSETCIGTQQECPVRPGASALLRSSVTVLQVCAEGRDWISHSGQGTQLEEHSSALLLSVWERPRYSFLCQHCLRFVPSCEHPGIRVAAEGRLCGETSPPMAVIRKTP